ncbi:MAG TPA: glycoside hydrolase family 125 protein, partial [Candidatus Xenobia bacterium]
YLIPANYMAVRVLRDLADMSREVASEALRIAQQVEGQLQRLGRAPHPRHGTVMPYEVDGFGSAVLMDDANVPSLLSLPYLGCLSTHDTVYRNTRALVLSPDNPWYFKGRAGDGIGSPHTGPNRIWPISLAMQALTSTDDAEIRRCLDMLKRTHAGTGFMHEAFDKDDATQFSRPWFAWANGLFGELISTVADRRPHVLA